MAIEAYDPGLVVFIWAGKTLSGFADGTFIEVDRDEDAVKKSVGSGGDVCRVFNRNKCGTATLTLMQSAASNDIMSAQARLDELLRTGAAPLLVKDLLGRTMVKADNAWVRKVPTITFANGIESRAWVLDTGPIDIFVGGNAAL